MYSKVRIQGFRRFEQLELPELKQVNLLVGLNNCGKTSVLEALAMLAAPSSLVEIARRRGELVSSGEAENDRGQTEVDLSYLFHGYRLGSSGFEIAGDAAAGHRLLGSVDSHAGILTLQLENRGPYSFELTDQLTLPLGGHRPGAFRLFFPDRGEAEVKWELIEPVGYSASKLISQWGTVVLTDHETLVVEVVRLIDPRISRIAYIPEGRMNGTGSAKAGFWILREGEPRVPLGNLGDGIWRLLMIALSLVNTAKGILLIDEIDSGLHYTVLEGMWRLVLASAARLDVQVFATTHSDDCWKALARVLEEKEGALDEQVSLQRIEIDRPQSVIFPGELVRIANQNKIEVR